MIYCINISLVRSLSFDLTQVHFLYMLLVRKGKCTFEAMTLVHQTLLRGLTDQNYLSRAVKVQCW